MAEQKVKLTQLPLTEDTSDSAQLLVNQSGADQRIAVTHFLRAKNSLADIEDNVKARANLGIGSAAVLNSSELMLKKDNQISSTATPGSILKFGDTGGIPTINIKNDISQRLLLTKDVSNPNDYAVLQINRNSNYEGGDKGFVGSALRVNSTARSTSNTSNYEWAALFQMNNYVPSIDSGAGAGSGAVPQQVALYGQANKYSTSATWAGCLEINDYTGTSANGAAIGLEITVRSTGADASAMTRVGAHIAAHTPDTSDGAEWGTAYYATSDATKNVRFRHVLRAEGIIGDSFICNAATTNQASAALIRDLGSLSLGIDLSAAKYSSGAAIRIKSGHKLSLDANDTNHFYGTSDGIYCSTPLKMQSSFSVASTNGSSSNVSTTATAGSNSAAPSAVDGYLIIKIDGVNKKIPYFKP